MAESAPLSQTKNLWMIRFRLLLSPTMFWQKITLGSADSKELEGSLSLSLSLVCSGILYAVY